MTHSTVRFQVDPTSVPSLPSWMEEVAVMAHRTHPESGMIWELYDCPSIQMLQRGPYIRVVIATHLATDDPPKVGQQRNGVVYELFVSTVQTPAMTANDLLVEKERKIR